MGCVNSRTDINDLHPNIFQVMNVDDLGNLITPGRLEVTDTDIVLYQRGKQPVNWPLRCLRRYGYDSEIFSFESGRRCSTGPGIYAFKCRRADQLFNLVQTNIQVCNNNNGDTDTISRDLSITPHSGPTLTRMTIPNEPNYLDPTPIRSNSRLVTRFSHNQHNGIGRLSSAGSSSGPLSPQGTMGSPSPPPMMMPPPPPPLQQSVTHQHPSALYVNDEVLSAFTMDLENNNNKNQRRSVQRSGTLSSTTSSIGIASEIPPTTAAATTTIAQYNSDNYQNQPPPPPPLSAMASYMNIDISNEASPLSPSHSFSLSTLLRDDNNETDTNHAYMNINPGNENIDTTNLPVTTIITSTTSSSLSSIAAISTTTIPTPTSIVSLTTTTASAAAPTTTTTTMTKKNKKSRPSLPILTNDYDDGSRHCYANLEPGEIENLRMMIPANTCSNDKSSLPPTTPSSESIKEVNYAILDLDKNNITTNDCNNLIPSPPDSPSNSYPQKGYATIDFNKTAALSHSVNPNVVNDNEGSRKTRHNSTINDLNSPTRQTSSISE